MSIETGQYKVVCFDEKGRRDKRFETSHFTLCAAVASGNAFIEDGEIHSFAVDRRLYNSLDVKLERLEGKA